MEASWRLQTSDSRNYYSNKRKTLTALSQVAVRVRFCFYFPLARDVFLQQMGKPRGENAATISCTFNTT